jgi:hypothetical protein
MIEIIRDITTDALRYWERRRLLYNALLIAVVLFYFIWGLPGSAAALTLDRLLNLFVLGVLANVAYCAAYVPDMFAQFSSLDVQWRRYRWLVFVAGSSLAAVLARTIIIAGLLVNG